MIAWGEAKKGIQAGIGFRAGKGRVYRMGETVTFVIEVCNVGDKPAAVDYLRPHEFRATITPAEGTTPAKAPDYVPRLFFAVIEKRPMKAGEVFEVRAEAMVLKPHGGERKDGFLMIEPGKYTIGYSKGGDPAASIDWKSFNKENYLYMARLVFEVKEAERPKK